MAVTEAAEQGLTDVSGPPGFVQAMFCRLADSLDALHFLCAFLCACRERGGHLRNEHRVPSNSQRRQPGSGGAWFCAFQLRAWAPRSRRRNNVTVSPMHPPFRSSNDFARGAHARQRTASSDQFVLRARGFVRCCEHFCGRPTARDTHAPARRTRRRRFPPPATTGCPPRASPGAEGAALSVRGAPGGGPVRRHDVARGATPARDVRTPSPSRKT